MKEGDRVEYIGPLEIRGQGTVLTVHECSGMVVVQWDAGDPRTSSGPSHVSLKDVRRITGSGEG